MAPPRRAIIETLLAQAGDHSDAEIDAIVSARRSATKAAALSRTPRLLDWDDYRQVRL